MVNTQRGRQGESAASDFQQQGGSTMRTVTRAAVVAALLSALLVGGVAGAAVYTYEGRGVGATRIGWKDSTAAARLSKTKRCVRDGRYSYVVYHWYVGKKLSNGRYPIELYAKSNRKVFRFQVNSSSYPTSRGVRIGTKESTLRARYSTERGPYTSGPYRRYTISHRYYSYTTYTDFYCRNGRVAYIIVRR